MNHVPLRRRLPSSRRARGSARALLLPTVFAVIAIGAACGKRENPPPPPASSSPVATTWPMTRDTDRGNYAVTLRPEGGVVERNRHFELDLQIQPRPGTAAPSSVQVDADMPAHGHGMNTQPEVIQKDALHYRIKGMLFHMTGEWSVSVTVSAGTSPEHVFFPVLVE